jgi:hypothetical protein
MVTTGSAASGSATGGVVGSGGRPIRVTWGSLAGCAGAEVGDGRLRIKAKAVMARISTTPATMGRTGTPLRAVVVLKLGALAMRAAARADSLWGRRGAGVGGASASVSKCSSS